jgi:putative FmdB family regulatory protein
MALYEFICDDCGTTAEVMQPFEAAAPTCENDMHSNPMRRLVSVPRRAIFTTGCTGAQLHERS